MDDSVDNTYLEDIALSETSTIEPAFIPSPSPEPAAVSEPEIEMEPVIPEPGVQDEREELSDREKSDRRGPYQLGRRKSDKIPRTCFQTDHTRGCFENRCVDETRLANWLSAVQDLLKYSATCVNFSFSLNKPRNWIKKRCSRLRT